MKLKFTDIEFSVLAELVCAGNWVINGSRLPDDIITPYNEMEEKITKLYAARKKVKGKPDPALCFDERLEQYFDFFAEVTMYRTLSKKYAAFVNPGADSKTLSEQEDSYFDELCANGLKNVLIKPRPCRFNLPYVRYP